METSCEQQRNSQSLQLSVLEMFQTFDHHLGVFANVLWPYEVRPIQHVAPVFNKTDSSFMYSEHGPHSYEDCYPATVLH